MSVDKDNKAEVIKDYQISPRDTGSTAVQIALLTNRIKSLQSHFMEFKKDNHSRRGLLMLVGQRKRMLSYLKRNDSSAYKAIIESLGLRK